MNRPQAASGPRPADGTGLRARVIAFYLPQFHPIPENDEWWGKGFTEWTNVAKAKPLFRGHYQPHVPADLGFYDLRVPEVRQAQADLARAHGIEGFCYWHYWSNGRQLLERPLNEVIESGKPGFPFCVAWANETWTRRWVGEDRQVLWKQEYGGDADDEAHFDWLLPALSDSRAIRVDGRPLFAVYRPHDLPDPLRTTDVWRRRAAAAGLPGLYLIAVENSSGSPADPAAMGFDAAVDFQPNWDILFSVPFTRGWRGIAAHLDRPLASARGIGRLWRNWRRRSKQKLLQSDGLVLPYAAAVRALSRQLVADAGQKRFPCVCPRWDNSPRKGKSAVVLTDDAPEVFAWWLEAAVSLVETRPADERLVFINAWNEWAEGNHLEPDLKWGHSYLRAVREAVQCR